MRFSIHLSERWALIIAVFIAGLCSIVYELVISTTSSYFLGDSVKQFSLIIGFYMAAMGIGSYLSKFIEAELLRWFVVIEVLLGFVGGVSVPLLYASFSNLSIDQFQVLVLLLTTLIGILTGFEIPLLTRIMKKFYPLKTNLANVLSLDYIGALAATLLFPFLLLPILGLFRTGITFGMLNIALGIFIFIYFSTIDKKQNNRWVLPLILVLLTVLSILFFFSNSLLQKWESNAYSHDIIHAEQSPYQQIVLTKNQDDVRLYLNRVIQFSSRDEYRYHEALALLPLGTADRVKNVLILGGGEGLLAREVLKSESVEQITIIDLDERVFNIGRQHGAVSKLNEGALHHPKVTTIAQDAAVFLRLDKSEYDLILADLPDPSHESVARLYSTSFFRLVHRRLAADGIFATQATGVFHTNNAFWCIFETVKSAGFSAILPYHVYVPSFGDWGFVMAAKQPKLYPRLPKNINMKYLEENRLANFFYFEPDVQNPGTIKPNTLDKPLLLDYFLDEWKTWRKEKVQ